MTRDPSDSGVGQSSPLTTPGGRQWSAINRELQELVHTLDDASDDVVRAHMARLHAQAEQIQDPVWRKRAHSHVDLLPRDIGGPKPGQSEQYWEAAELVRRFMATDFDDPSQLTSAGDRVIEQVADLAEAVPDEEFLIKGMNNIVNRRILRAGSSDG